MRSGEGRSARRRPANIASTVALRRPLRLVLALALFTAVAVAWFLPLIRHLESSVPYGPDDSTSTIREYWLADYLGKSPFTLNHDPLVGSPEGSVIDPAVTIANAVQPAFILALRGVVGLVGAWNLWVLVGFVLSAFTMFLLLDRLGLGILPALFGGYVFGFSPYLFEKARAGHGGLMQAWIFPVLVLLLLRLHEQPKVTRAALVGVGLAGAFYLHSYYGLLGSVLVAVFFVVEVARERARAQTLWRVTLFDVVAVASGLLLAPAFYALATDHTTVTEQYSHPLAALQQFGARPLAYLVPAKSNPFFGWILDDGQRQALTQTGEPQLFFGWSTLLLALAAVVLLVRRDRVFSGQSQRYAAISAAALVPVAFLMSLPRIVHLGPVSIPAPSYFIGSVSTFWRVYARFGVLVGLGLVLLAAFALQALLRRGRAGAMAAAVIVAFAVLELASPVHAWRTNRLPAYDVWLVQHPGGTVAFYPPYGATDSPGSRLFTQELFYQRVHHHPIFQSGSTKQTRSWAIRSLTGYLDNEFTPGILAAENVRYVIVVDSAYREEGTTPVIPPADYRPVARVPGAQIYRVAAAPIDLDDALRLGGSTVAGAMGYLPPSAVPVGGGFAPPQESGGREWRWLKQDGVILVRSTRSMPVRFDVLASSASVPRTLEIRDGSGRPLGSAIVPTGQTEILIGPFSIRKGRSTLILHVRPGPTNLPGESGRRGSIFLSPFALQPYVDFTASNASTQAG